MIHGLFPLAVLLATGCTTAAAMPEGPLSGSWGGEHVRLTFTPEIALVEFDCGSGRIEVPVTPGPDGRFTAEGSHSPGQGGPDRVDQRPAIHLARYHGRVTGDEMVLEGEVPSIGAKLGPYRLRRGAEPTLFRCL